MNVKDYCAFINSELTAWKSKMYTLERRLKKIETSKKNKILPDVETLHMLIEDITELIEQLCKECPADWRPIKKEIEKSQLAMKIKFEEIVTYITFISV